MANPKITLVIPTRERLPVLRHCLQTALAQDYGNFIILVSDNASTDGTGAFIQTLDDPRVRYVNTGQRLSMAKNWEFALSHVDDGWIIFLGDDDGILPGAIRRLAEIIDTTDCEAITFRACNYVWPGTSGADFGRLVIPFCEGREERWTADWLLRVRDSRTDYLSLPMIYTLGIASMRLINRVRERSDLFFNSSIPDIYSSIALTRSTSKYLYVNQPFAIIGCSRLSNSGSFGASGNGGEHRRFMAENDIPFHRDLALQQGEHPLSYQMFVYEAFLQSSFLDTNAPDPPRARQLALALAHPYAPERFDTANHEWGREFARMHGLDFDAALAAAKSLRRKWKLKTMILRLRAGYHSLVIHDSSIPLENVYTASLVAAAALWTHPSAFARLLRNGRYALRRLSAQSKR